MSKIIISLSSYSYIFYLIHADLGYFCRTKWYSSILPFLLKGNIVEEGFVTNEIVLMIVIVTVVLCTTAVLNKVMKIGMKCRI